MALPLDNVMVLVDTKGLTMLVDGLPEDGLLDEGLSDDGLTEDGPTEDGMCDDEDSEFG